MGIRLALGLASLDAHSTSAGQEHPLFAIPFDPVFTLQRFCGWCEEFAITVYWHVCFMSVLGDHNSMFDTLVRMTSALRLRIPGMVEDAETVDALPITLMSH